MVPDPRTETDAGRSSPGCTGTGLTRRRVLRLGAATVVGSVAGCSSGDQTRTIDHPAAADLGDQPRLGPPPSESDATVIVFEDPSCPVCRAFEERTVPKLRANLIDAGQVTFYAREYPIVAPWGTLGSRLLEAVYDRSEEAFWRVRADYFDHQEEIRSNNLYDHTRRYLEDTAVDADAVVEAVQGGGYRGAVQADVRAAKNADVKGTPTLFLFESGEYLTDIVGAPSYTLLENALGY